MYTQGNLSGGGLTDPLPVLSPSNILSQLSSHCPFIPERKNVGRVKTILFQIFLNF
jgi:hypothetical protein